MRPAKRRALSTVFEDGVPHRVFGRDVARLAPLLHSSRVLIEVLRGAFLLTGRRHMHTHSLETWQHEHVFLGDKHEHNERRAWFVVVFTTAMMIVEIAGGHLFGSMALVADGWHMSTHAAALTIASALAWLIACPVINVVSNATLII